MKRSTVPITRKFTEALDNLVDQIKSDRSILAAILCGSLSHDTVWVKSDIDLVLVTIDDKKIESASIALYANGVNVHTCLMPRTEFRKLVESSLGNSFMHSMLSKGRLLYTHDETIPALLTQLQNVGERDKQVQLLSAAIQALAPIDKAHKWLITRGDLNYTALWILYAATALARIEVISANQIADREVILQAIRLNASFFKLIYTDLLNAKKTPAQVKTALDAVDQYIAVRAKTLFRPLIDHLREVQEARSATEIEAHFRRNFNVGGVVTACEYLADVGLIGKASIAIQLTKRSNCMVEELAFVYLEDAPDGGKD